MQKHLSNIASLESSQLRDEPQLGEKAPLAPGGEAPCLQLAVLAECWKTARGWQCFSQMAGKQERRCRLVSTTLL